MLRVANNVCRVAACLSYAAIVACSGSNDTTDSSSADTAVAGELRVVFTPMFSAYDGLHDYRLPVTVDQAALDVNGLDPVLPESMQWTVDPKMASKEPYPELLGAVLLTTRDSGTTTVSVVATTKSGKKVKGTSILQITKASDAEWQLGQERYDNMVAINFGMFGMPGAAGAAGTGAVPVGAGGVPDFASLIPKNASCGNCHNNATGITVEHTPQQTAGYSDDDLIKIFTTGAKPMGAGFNSPLFKMVPVQFAMSIYTMLHTWDIAPEVQRGIVFKLRSIQPKTQADIDITRLRTMTTNQPAPAAGSGASAASGAAGN
jgi:hypothetical protein